jgi:protease IV
MASIGGFFRGVWRGLDGLRRFLHLLLLLAIFGFIIGALRSSIPHLPAKAALVIHPQGRIVEQLASDPIERAFSQASGRGEIQTLLWDVTEAIDAAAKDKRVQALVLELDDMQGAGQPALEEIAAALGRFRAAGKKVVAQATTYSQAQYYLAAQSDELYLDPFGTVLIEGFERYRMYFKGALEKLSVDMHLFRVGAYKSAAETYVRKDMSPEDREESLTYLNALWHGYQGAVGTARKLPDGALATYANGFVDALKAAGGNAADVALKAGLVTALKSRPEVERRIIELVGEDSDTHSYNAIALSDYTRVVKAERSLRKDRDRRVAVIVASGEILDGVQPPGTVGGESTAKLIHDARLDDKVRAVVLRIDSPGGSVMASEQIYREVLALKAAGKPVVVSMSTVAASGGYYIAAPADEIFASATTITGSIGIFATLPTVDRALDRLGITVDGVGTTALSGAQRLDRPLTPALAGYVQSQIEYGYEQFLGHVSAGRGKTRDQIHQIAQGRVWIGSDAHRIGLVDTLGGYDAAVKSAARRAKLGEDYVVERVEPDLSWAQQLVLQLRVRLAQLAGSAVGAPLSRLTALPAALSPLEAELGRFRRLAAPNRSYAYCFCTVE